MNLHAVDLNLFLVFQAVYVTRSATQAGEHLNITQSAVSNSLKRLRERFDDVLFVKTINGMMPTPMAERLIAPISLGIKQFNTAIEIGDIFDPKTTSRTFRIAINEVGHLVMIPNLLKLLQNYSSDIKVETMSGSAVEIRNGLQTGHIDIAIGSWFGLGPSFYQQRLFYESFVVLMNNNNPNVSDELTMASYLDGKHISFKPHGSTDTELDMALHNAGIKDRRKIVYVAAHSQGFVAILKDSDFLITVPRRLANVLVSDCNFLKISEIPIALEPFQIRQQWHERVQQDPGHRWLRELLFELFNDSASMKRTPSIDVEFNDKTIEI